VDQEQTADEKVGDEAIKQAEALLEITKILRPLSHGGRRRVLRYMADRLGLTGEPEHLPTERED